MNRPLILLGGVLLATAGITENWALWLVGICISAAAFTVCAR